MNMKKDRVGIIDRLVRYQWAIVLAVYFLLKPLYLSRSGTMQISDTVLISAFLLYVLSSRMRVLNQPEYQGVLLTYAGIVVIQFIVNYVWYLSTNDFAMIRYSFFYIFNFIAYYFTIVIINKQGLQTVKRAIVNGAFLSLLLTAFGLIIYSGRSSRSTGFFNNPNQLGYYAIVMLAVLMYVGDQLKPWKRGVSFVIAMWSIILSMSKAAILAVIVFLAMWILFGQKKPTVGRKLFQLFVLVVFAVVVYDIFLGDGILIGSNAILLQLRDRILNMSSEGDTDFYTGRAYGRILETGFHFLWGMGEGAFGRFETATGIEIHSTYASLIVCYGWLGFGAYVYVFCRSVHHRHLRKMMFNLSCMSGILLYGLTHNGIRNTLVWVLIALLTVDNMTAQPQISAGSGRPSAGLNGRT